MYDKAFNYIAGDEKSNRFKSKNLYKFMNFGEKKHLIKHIIKSY